MRDPGPCAVGEDERRCGRDAGRAERRRGHRTAGGPGVGAAERVPNGIVRRGKVLTWATSVGGAEEAPSFFETLTQWECSDSSFHLEDVVPVDEVLTVDGAPVIKSRPG
jgi:hypothetical protein